MKKDRDEKGRFLPGNKARETHGLYSRRLSLRIRREGDRLRQGLIMDLGPNEEDLTTAQKAIIEKSCGLYQISRAIEDWIGKEGIIRKNKLNPVLTVYISHVNSLRLCLRELGITSRASEKALTPLQIAAEIEQEKQ